MNTVCWWPAQWHHRTQILAFALLLGACGGPRNDPAFADLPAWVQQPPTRLGMAYAVGIGYSPDSAQQNGKNEVLAQLQVTIEALREDQTLITRREDSSGSRSAQMMNAVAESVLQRVAMQDVSGLRVAERAQGADGTHYALVALDRQAWAATLRQQITQLDTQLDAAWQTYQNDLRQRGTLDQVAHLSGIVLPPAIEREALARRYALVNPGGSLATAPVATHTIRSAVAALLDGISIALAIGPDLAPIAVDCRQSLIARGFHVLDDPEAAQLVVELDLTIRGQAHGGLYRADGTLTGSIRESGSGRLLAAVRAEERASGNSPAIAGDRLKRKLAPLAAQAIDQALIERLAER